MRGEQARFEQETQGLLQQLQQYIYNYTQQGYKPKELETYLVSKGYEKELVEQAMQFVDTNYYHGTLLVHDVHKPSSHKPLLFLLGFVVVAIVLSIFIFFPTQRVVTPQLGSSVLLVGDDLNILLNNASSSGQLRYAIYNQNNAVVTQADVSVVPILSISLPDDLNPGTYTIALNSLSDYSLSQSVLSFQIGEPSLDQASNEQPVLNSQQDRLSLAVSTQDAHECEAITNNVLRNECYYTIARDTDNVDLCASIDNDSKRDDCYLVLAPQHDVCNLMSLPENKALCDEVRS